MTINATEYGLAVNLNVNYDLSAATGLLMTFERPNGTIFSGVPTISSTPLSTPDQGTFSANQYARYIIKDGDLTVPGTYRVRLVYMDNTKRLLSDLTSFDVSL